jgi:hypothetical protein
MVMGCAYVASLLMVASANGVTNNVSSIAGLQTAIYSTAVGDGIVLANGNFLIDAWASG